MKKGLLIAEKTSEMNIIMDVYNKHKGEFPFSLDALSQAGHLLTLKKPNEIDEEYGKWCWEHLPFHPEKNGGWAYKMITGTKPPASLAKGKYQKIKDAIKSGDYDFIVHAGDADQEGQLLVDIVLQSLKVTLPIKRYWSNDTTEPGVLKALNSLIDYSDDWQQNLLKAAYARQHSDYRFGMNLSEAASLKMGTRVAVGRVKTPILSIVCKREEDIKNFKPSTSYGIRSIYSKEFDGQLYNPSSESTDSEEKEDVGMVYYDTKEEADEIIAKLHKIATVESFEKKRVETFAPKLYKLATAQVDAGKMGFSSSKTLDIIQSLYLKGYVSYPRTDCECIASTEDFYAIIKSAMSVPVLEPYIKTISKAVIEKVKVTKKWVNDKELKSHGHSALIPTVLKPDFSKLTIDEQKIYEMICKRFIAIFLPPIIQEKTSLIADIDGYKFKSSGKTLIDAGFSKVFDTKFTDMLIPEMKKGDKLDVESFEYVEKTTKCPNHLSDTEIIKICEAPHKYLNDDKYKSLGEHLKIGTSATRASIIKGLIDIDKYLAIEKAGRKEYLVPTEIGKMIYENLKFCKICQVDLTGEWEVSLDKLRNGELAFDDYEKSNMKDVEILIEDIKGASIEKVAAFGRGYPKVCECPSCGGDILSGPKGFFCSNWKEKSCKTGAYKKICDSEITNDEFSTLLSGKPIMKTIKKGSTKWIQKLLFNTEENKVVFDKTETETKYKCPSCSSNVTDKGSLYECSCGFKFWKNKLTDKQINKFFTEGTTGIVKGLKSKKGTFFDAEIVLSDDKKGTTFKFPNKKI